MSSSNYRRNKAFIDKYRKELKAMLGDISQIDVRCLNKAVNVGLADAKKKYASSYRFHAEKLGCFTNKGKSLWCRERAFNTADYASYVNYGHRVVNRKGGNSGIVKGKFILQRL